MAPRVFIVAIDGASCSGKTTLAKHLQRILPNAVILHQDDFAPPQEQIPLHPVHGVQDWDDAKGAIDWPLQRSTLRYLRSHGSFPDLHYSHDALNEEVAVPISDQLQLEWTTTFQELLPRIQREEEGMVFVLADGFLMLCDEESVEEFDLRILVREQYDVLKQRRDKRSGYHTAVDDDPAGTMWRDPPNYWENIVWPAYVSAHAPLFLNGDVEAGQPDSKKIEGVVLLEASELKMDGMVDRACQLIRDRLESGRKVGEW